MARGGKRPGAGRTKGSKNKSTLEREAVLREYRQKIMRNAGKLFLAQMTLAHGVTHLFKIEKEWVATSQDGKRGYYRKKRPKLVTNEEEILAYLEGRVREAEDEDDDQDPAATYYFITTRDPDKFTISDMLDRSLGKPTQPIGGDKENPLIVKGIEIRVRK